MFGARPPTKSIRIPIELSDAIIDYALEVATPRTRCTSRGHLYKPSRSSPQPDTVFHPLTASHTTLPFLDALVYHPEASCINILADKRFFSCASGMCQRLRCLDITASETDIKGVHGIIHASKATLETLKLRIMGWPVQHTPPCFLLRGCRSLQSLSFDVSEGYTSRMTSSLDTLAVDNVLATIHINMTVVLFYTRPAEWEELFEVIQDRHGFPMLETCFIRLRCFCTTHTYISTHSSTTERTIQRLIDRHTRAGDPQVVVTREIEEENGTSSAYHPFQLFSV